MKNKFIYSILILCFSFCFHFSSAQSVPGYLGKKGFIDYNFTSPFFPYLAPKWTNFVHNLRMNYVIRRRAQIGTSVEYFSIKADHDNLFDDIDVEYKAKGTSIGVNFDWYSKSSIAPLGTYFRLEYKRISADYESLGYPAFDGLPPVVEEGSFNLNYFGFGYGLRRIFYDKMVFNVGGSFGFTGSAGLDNEGTVGLIYSVQMHVGVGYLLF